MNDQTTIMVLWWSTNIFSRLAAAWFPLLFSSLIWQTIMPTHAVPSCPRSCSCPGVKEVHCTFRRLTTIPKTFPKDTKRINLGYNSLTEVDRSQFRSLQQLEMLMLHGNDITTVRTQAFYSLRSLQVLTLSYNKLTLVNPALFKGLVGLVRLHLDHNLIDFIEPYSFSGLTSLKLLHLEGNLLREIHPHTFITVTILGSFWTSGLKHLHLSDNLLEQLPATVLNTAPRLELLSLHGNPWTCDCQLHWLVEWGSTHQGIIKCKKNRATIETCPQCSSPPSLNGTLLFGVSPDRLTCERPALYSPLKEWDNPVWAGVEAEPDLPNIRKFEKPFGQLMFVLSDIHGNSAHATCNVQHPGDTSAMTWAVNPLSQEQLIVSVSLVTSLECEIDREILQNLWQLVAYYYESPAVLERGQQRRNASRITYQYRQAVNENSPYFTDLNGYLVAEPSWLLQPSVNLKLNRQQTTTKKLVMDFSTVLTKHHSGWEDDNVSWGLIHRGTAGRIQSALDGSMVVLQCSVVTSDPEVKVEWILPDLSIVEKGNNKIEISEKGELVILNASLSDSGLYHCMVRTKDFADWIPLRLTIKERSLSPTAFNGQKIVVEKGQSFSLPCEGKSVHPSQITWYLPKNQFILPTQYTKQVEMIENGTLVVQRLTEENSGEYSCLVSNLYGVDMLSHMVEVTEKMDSKSSIVLTEREEQEEEGSGGKYQEIIQPFATHVLKNVGAQQKKPTGFYKGIKMKNSKKITNISLKELAPSHWAETLAKIGAKSSDGVPTDQVPTEPNIVTVIISVLKSTIATSINPNILQPTTAPTDSIHFLQTKTEAYSTENKRSDWEDFKTLGSVFPKRTDPTSHPVSRFTEKAEAVTGQPAVRTLSGNESENKHYRESRRNYGIIPRQNRKRVSHRRRKPPMRVRPRLRPFYHSSNKTPTTTPATAEMTPTTPAIAVVATVENHEIASSTYPTTADEDEKSHYNRRGSDITDAKDLNGETSDTTNDHGSRPTTFLFARDKDSNIEISSEGHPKPVNTAKQDRTPHPTQSTTEDTDSLNQRKPNRMEIRTQILETIRDNKILGGESEQGAITEMSENLTDIEENHKSKEKITNTTDGFKLTAQKGPNSQAPLEQNTTIQTITSNSTRGEVAQNKEPKAVSETNSFPITDPPHPWLYQIQQSGAQTNSRSTKTTPHPTMGRKEKVNPDMHSKATISYWPNHQRHIYFTLSPSWPPQSSFPHPAHGPESRSVHTQRPWPVTNRPEITAETAKPTSTVSQATEPHLSRHQNQNHHVDVRMQTRDYLFLSRLRNRYRQAQLNRIALLGRLVTPKPRSGYRSPPSQITPKPDLSPHRPYIPKPPPPTASYSNSVQPPKPSELSSSSSGFIPHPEHSTDTRAQHEGQWPFERIISSQRPTVAAAYPWVLKAERKPRIITVITSALSVLAGSDVSLPCKASGNPEPSIAWTKISTGSTIPANTKYGPRFEVLQNGTFVIKNTLLQDRGQYLCTAQNRFGTDRMVITLAVLMEVPTIQRPKATDVEAYFGRSVSLHCFSSGKPPAKISWILPDRTVVCEVGAVHTPLSPVSLFQNGTLQIHSPNFSSKGNYKCTASNAAGTDAVSYHLRVAALPPSISEEAMDTVVIPPGRSVSFHCSVKGGPHPTLKWTLPDGVHVKPSQFLGRRLFVFPNGTLYVRSVSPADAGRYECLATNFMGFAERTILLQVSSDSPSFSHQTPVPLPIPPAQRRGGPSRQHTVSAMYSSAVFLHCPESTGTTTGTIWQLPSNTIMEHQNSPESPIKVFRNGTLRILQLTELDGGNYLCVFEQPNGKDMKLFLVEVLMTPPRIEHVRAAQTRVTFGGNFQVDCVVTGLPNPEVSWRLPDGTLINNTLQSDNSGLSSHRYVIFGNGTLFLQQMAKNDEGDYTCHAKNKLGKDERKVSIKVEPNAPEILPNSPSVVRVKLGESAKLICEAKGEPSPKILWISPGNDVISKSSDKFQILEDGMWVRKVRLADEGKYACVAQNAAGDNVKNIKLEVEPKEPFINGMTGKSSTKVLAVFYQTALLSCRAEGKPQPKVWWVTPYGLSLPTPYLGGRFQVHQNGSMELRGVRKTDEGMYMCLAKNNLGEASLRVEFYVTSLAEKPSFALPNIEILQMKKDGGLLLLECSARGKPKPDFSWILPNGLKLAPGVSFQRFTHHLSNGTLQIIQPTVSDKGVYRCLAKNIAGQAEKRYALEAGRKPVIRGSTGVVKITYGLSLSLPCSVDSSPPALITWTLPNGLTLEKPQIIGRVSLFTNGTLQVKQVATFDKGTYTCKASNTFGSSTLSYPVVVTMFPPRITSMLASVTRVSRGTSVKLTCATTGIPKPDISWTLPGRTTLVPHHPFTMQGGIFMTEEGSLVIQEPVLMNSGIYRCNAKNALGADFKSTYIQVE